MSDSVDLYDFALPEDLIASRPLAKRDASRMLVLHRESGQVEHRMFCDFPDYVNPGDRVVLNNSKVFKARVYSDDGKIEFLFLEEVEPRRWMCMVRPGRKMRENATCRIGDTSAKVVSICPTGERIIELDGVLNFEQIGHVPVPPYFHRADDSEDESRYQTVYAGPVGSVAAPTAGLHFTPEVLARIPHTFLTLHVGIGTFQPVKTNKISEHVMHAERFSISESAAQEINSARRIIAIGTTSARVLESQPPGAMSAVSGSTDIFIYPPYSFHRVDALLTNFHLPKSTLIMLVSAMAGRENILNAYREAVRERYRFFSYGDCMLIV
ncbi:MAG: tRNA preQ1(34) S-adenosylmethionine ribosyltransferase-isomerase QueA [Chthoniobacterales bacterium]